MPRCTLARRWRRRSRREGLRLDLDALVPFARWLPGARATCGSSTRASTWRACPRTRRAPRVDATENARLFWASAADVLAMCDARRSDDHLPDPPQPRAAGAVRRFRRCRRRCRALAGARRSRRGSRARATPSSAYPGRARLSGHVGGDDVRSARVIRGVRRMRRLGRRRSRACAVAGAGRSGAGRGAHRRTCPGRRSTWAQPIGMFTGRKLAALTEDFPPCRALLDRGRGALHARCRRWIEAGGQCGYARRRAADRRRRAADRPCAARARHGLPGRGGAGGVGMGRRPARRAGALSASRSPRIEHFGSYNCRRIYGPRRGQSGASMRRANAIDIAGVRAGRRDPDHRRRRLAGKGNKRRVPARRARRRAAGCSRRCCRPTTTPRTATISTSTRRSAARWAGARAASQAATQRCSTFSTQCGKKPAGGSTSPTRSPPLR